MGMAAVCSRLKCGWEPYTARAQTFTKPTPRPHRQTAKRIPLFRVRITTLSLRASPRLGAAYCQGTNFHKARPATTQANCKEDSLFRVGITTLSLRASPQPGAVHCQGTNFHKARSATTQANRKEDSPVSRGDNDPISARFPATWRRALPG